MCWALVGAAVVRWCLTRLVQRSWRWHEVLHAAGVDVDTLTAPAPRVSGDEPPRLVLVDDAVATGVCRRGLDPDNFRVEITTRQP